MHFAKSIAQRKKESKTYPSEKADTIHRRLEKLLRRIDELLDGTFPTAAAASSHRSTPSNWRRNFVCGSGSVVYANVHWLLFCRVRL